MLNLAGTRNSPDRSTKSTRSYLNVVPQLVNTGFQVLFHSPPGVLFTFPSQYYALSVTEKYLALEGGPSAFPQGFSCLVVLRILLGVFMISCTRLSLSMAGLPRPFYYHSHCHVAVHTPECTHSGLGSSAFARRYLRNRCFFLFLSLLRCFSSGGSRHIPMYSVYDD